jgi:Zn-dependent protease with chaperone function
LNASQALPLVDTPRIGPSMWVLLVGLLLPPALVTWAGNTLGGMEHQTLWVILLGCPFVLMVLSLPRKYELDADQLTIRGLFYRLRIPRSAIRSVRRAGRGAALTQLGSVFSSDPARALRIERASGWPVMISPRDPAPFLALDPNRASEPS